MKEEKTLLQSLPDESELNVRRIRHAVKIGCAVNALLMIMKLAAGYFGHSEALMADGFHSLNDMAADLIMLFFVGISYRAADARYSYGYGKFETFSTFLISSFLIIVACMIGYEAIETIVDYANGEELPRPDIWALTVVIIAMACKEILFRYYSHIGRKTESKAMISNAWHHRSDALSSVAVLIGVSCSYFLGGGWRIMDSIVSLLIAGLILFAAIRLFRPSFKELMECSLPEADVTKAKEMVLSTPGVDGITSFRTRRNGHHLIFDIGIEVDSELTVAAASAIAAEIETRLREAFCPHIYINISTFAGNSSR